MKSQVFVFDPTADDELSRVRGIGRYLELLKENFPDWIFTSKIKGIAKEATFINPFFNFLKPPLTMKKVAARQIAVIHDLIPLKYPAHFPSGFKGGLNIMLNKLALKNYELIITDSETSKRDIVELLKVEENRVKVIYPCLTKEFTNSQSAIPNSRISQLENDELRITDYCLYVGDATWNKNLVNLAKAIKIADLPCVFVGKVFEQLKNYELRIADSKNAWLKEFEEFSKITRGDKRLIFKGFIKNYELIKLYQQAKVNLLLSRDEGFGFSYLEATHFACPSILSDTQILKEISNGQGALFADPNDPNDISVNIRKIFSDKSLRQKLSSEALERAKNFNFFSFTKKWNDLINQPTH